MSVIFILIGCSLLLASSFLVAFLWASKAGQFEDDYTPSVRMLFNDGTITKPQSNSKKPKKDSSIKPIANVSK